MNRDQLQARSRAFSMDIIALCLTLGIDDLARLIRPQLVRAGTGVTTNYRAACRGRSDREFASKLATVVEESDESEFWLDVLQVFERGDVKTVARLRQEATELRAIMASARSTTLERIQREAAQRRSRIPNHRITESQNH